MNVSLSRAYTLIANYSRVTPDLDNFFRDIHVDLAFVPELLKRRVQRNFAHMLSTMQLAKTSSRPAPCLR